MSFTTPVPMSCSSDSRYRPLPFALDPHASQYNRERREPALAPYLQEQFVNQPTANALHAEESYQSPNQRGLVRDLCTRMPKDENFDPQFPSYSSMAHWQAEIQHAIRDQDVREHVASIREWHNIAAFRAHLGEQRLFARRRSDTENFHARSGSPVPIQDEPSLKDMISSHLIELHRLMVEHQFEVRDMLQAILAHLSKGSTIRAPTECDPATFPTTIITSNNVSEEGPTPSQKGQETTKEIADSDIQEELPASPAQVASSLSRISSITARLETLLDAFQFPVELDFSPALGAADVSALTYTPANAPVHTQMYALSLLFAGLDNVPSFGSDVVRNARRAVVTRVDQALQELDKGVEERRCRARAKKADRVSVPID